MDADIYFKPCGENALLIELKQEISIEVNKTVTFITSCLNNNFSTLIHEIIPAYCSVMIVFDAEQTKHKELENIVLGILSDDAKNNKITKVHSWELPVCYHPKFGLDLEEISRSKEIAIDDIINIHSQVYYHVHFFGFLPGFLYLGGLDQQIFQARRSTPREKVKQGSVAIGGQQTGVYPCDCPAGWNIIGHCPIPLFDPDNKSKPCFISAGDRVSFRAISVEEHRIVSKNIADQTGIPTKNATIFFKLLFL